MIVGPLSSHTPPISPPGYSFQSGERAPSELWNHPLPPFNEEEKAAIEALLTREIVITSEEFSLTVKTTGVELLRHLRQGPMSFATSMIGSAAMKAVGPGYLQRVLDEAKKVLGGEGWGFSSGVDFRYSDVDVRNVGEPVYCLHEIVSHCALKAEYRGENLVKDVEKAFERRYGSESKPPSYDLKSLVRYVIFLKLSNPKAGTPFSIAALNNFEIMSAYEVPRPNGCFTTSSVSIPLDEFLETGKFPAELRPVSQCDGGWTPFFDLARRLIRRSDDEIGWNDWLKAFIEVAKGNKPVIDGFLERYVAVLDKNIVKEGLEKAIRDHLMGDKDLEERLTRLLQLYFPGLDWDLSEREMRAIRKQCTSFIPLTAQDIQTAGESVEAARKCPIMALESVVHLTPRDAWRASLMVYRFNPSLGLKMYLKTLRTFEIPLEKKREGASWILQKEGAERSIETLLPTGSGLVLLPEHKLERFFRSRSLSMALFERVSEDSYPYVAEGLLELCQSLPPWEAFLMWKKIDQKGGFKTVDVRRFAGGVAVALLLEGRERKEIEPLLRAAEGILQPRLAELEFKRLDALFKSDPGQFLTDRSMAFLSPEQQMRIRARRAVALAQVGREPFDELDSVGPKYWKRSAEEVLMLCPASPRWRETFADWLAYVQNREELNPFLSKLYAGCECPERALPVLEKLHMDADDSDLLRYLRFLSTLKGPRIGILSERAIRAGDPSLMPLLYRACDRNALSSELRRGLYIGLLDNETHLKEKARWFREWQEQVEEPSLEDIPYFHSVIEELQERTISLFVQKIAPRQGGEVVLAYEHTTTKLALTIKHFPPNCHDASIFASIGILVTEGKSPNEAMEVMWLHGIEEASYWLIALMRGGSIEQFAGYYFGGLREAIQNSGEFQEIVRQLLSYTGRYSAEHLRILIGDCEKYPPHAFVHIRQSFNPEEGLRVSEVVWKKMEQTTMAILEHAFTLLHLGGRNYLTLSMSCLEAVREIKTQQLPSFISLCVLAIQTCSEEEVKDKIAIGEKIMDLPMSMEQYGSLFLAFAPYPEGIELALFFFTASIGSSQAAVKEKTAEFFARISKVSKTKGIPEVLKHKNFPSFLVGSNPQQVATIARWMLYEGNPHTRANIDQIIENLRRSKVDVTALEFERRVCRSTTTLPKGTREFLIKGENISPEFLNTIGERLQDMFFGRLRTPFFEFLKQVNPDIALNILHRVVGDLRWRVYIDACDIDYPELSKTVVKIIKNTVLNGNVALLIGVKILAGTSSFVKPLDREREALIEAVEGNPALRSHESELFDFYYQAAAIDRLPPNGDWPRKVLQKGVVNPIDVFFFINLACCKMGNLPMDDQEYRRVLRLFRNHDKLITGPAGIERYMKGIGNILSLRSPDIIMNMVNIILEMERPLPPFFFLIYFRLLGLLDFSKVDPKPLSILLSTGFDLLMDPEMNESLFSHWILFQEESRLALYLMDRLSQIAPNEREQLLLSIKQAKECLDKHPKGQTARTWVIIQSPFAKLKEVLLGEY